MGWCIQAMSGTYLGGAMGAMAPPFGWTVLFFQL